MKQKILFLITKSNFGGAQKYVFDLATSLRSTYDVSVALGGDGKLRELLHAQGIPVHVIPDLVRDVSFKKEWHSFISMYRLFRAERPNIVHLNSSKAGVLGALAARFARVPHIVFTSHGWAWNEERSFFSRTAIGVFHWLTVMFAHRTICVSHSVYDQMAKLPFTKRRMRVIHLGITPLPRLSREQARAQCIARVPALKEKQNALWVATVAELHPIKGFPYALTAFTEVLRALPDTVYLIMGEGEERARIENFIRGHQLTASVFLLGHVDDAPALFEAFDLLVVASLSESFSYVLVEAGAAGVPVVATRAGGMPEIIEDDGGVLVPPKESAVLADAMREMLRNTEKRRIYAATLKDRVLTYFTKERMVEETIAFYEELSR